MSVPNKPIAFIDVGNTRTKYALLDVDQINDVELIQLTLDIQYLANENPSIEFVRVCQCSIH